MAILTLNPFDIVFEEKYRLEGRRASVENLSSIYGRSTSRLRSFLLGTVIDPREILQPRPGRLEIDQEPRRVQAGSGPDFGDDLTDHRRERASASRGLSHRVARARVARGADPLPARVVA